MDTSVQSRNSLRHNAKTTNNDAEVKAFKAEVLPSILPILECILLDGYNLLDQYGYTDYNRDLATLRKRFLTQGIGFIQKSLPDLFSNTLRYLETGVSDYPGFRLQKGTKHPRFMRKLFVLIYDCTASDEAQTQAVKILYQLCVAFKKLEGPYPTRVLRDSVANFVENDKKLGRINLRSKEASIIFQHARACITQLFHGLEHDSRYPELPRPGSGATNQPVEKNERYRPHVLYTQLHDVYDYDMWFNTPYQYIFGGEAVEYSTMLESEYSVVHDPTSRYKSIHKVLGKPRGICIEENETQFFQQGLRVQLYPYVENHPRTAGKVNFTDQSINRDLALRSSVTLEYATVDMTEASDNVDREIVLGLFLLTCLFEKLSAVSTRLIELPKGLGQKRHMLAHKFAPMGSGVCFPVMSLVHWSLIQGIIASSQMPDSHKLCKEVYVYGDDIIVPSSCVHLVYKYLPLFGMKINVEKSYVNSHFRESCGCHAYKGVDITPAYIKKVISHTTKRSDSSTLISLISKEFRLRSNGFEHTARHLRKQVHNLYGDLPTVNVDSSIVGWKTNDHVPKAHLMPYCNGVKKSRDDPQQLLYKFRVARAKAEKLPCLEDDRGYFRKQTMFTEDSRYVSGDSEDLRVFWTWVPEPTLSDDIGKIANIVTRRTKECSSGLSHKSHFSDKKVYPMTRS